MPSQFDITVASLQRLVKEEKSYHEELEQQKARIAKLESDATGDDENLEYQIKQEVVLQSRQAIEETRKVLPALKTRVRESVDKMEKLLEESKGSEDGPTIDGINKAKEVIASAKSSIREIS